MKAGALRWAPALFFVLCVGWYYQRTVATQLPGISDSDSDFRPYYEASRFILHGQSPFLANGYIYPPLLAFVLTPLAPFDYVTARRIWFALQQLCLIGAAVLLWWKTGRDWTAACWIALVWAASGAAEESLGLGQVGPLLTLLTVVAMTQARWRRGAAVAAAFALKLLPGLLAVAVVLRRERQAIQSTVLVALAAILLPWVAVATILQGPTKGPTIDAWMGTPATLSWSLPSVVLRAMDPPRQAVPLPQSWLSGNYLQRFRLGPRERLASLGTAAITLLAGLWFLVRRAGTALSEQQVPWVIAALTSLALAATPVGWSHYQILQYPGIALLLMHCWRKRHWTQLAIAIALASLLYVAPVAVLTAYYERYHAWTAHSPFTLYLWTSVTPFASLGLFGMFVGSTTSLKTEQPDR